ncbi:orotidine-5'-phosphate decarboxylase [Agrococcus carbonis]|uniref:Orotidine-5'-phosphate decarboxylase n=1 Tax=Agrococcus carbonis TaxID=684552 RepID=A0A1H1KY26_9MICO|nr:orotidine-5'-phosphate decarboxylase [Agrococcus carbonis]SDR66930.1 orotidine-5'-phosphate decarboxylase [Agrococcus carbonis]
MTSQRPTFLGHLTASVAAHGPLCVGIDPHPALLDAWGAGADAAGLERFGRTAVEAAAGRVAVVKPQVALFEAHGSAGLGALERVLADARAAGLLVIADAKRGDIGSTNTGYAAAWLTPGSPLEADALTVSPYLGVDALDGAFAAAEAAGKALFVLAATSNPEARALQSARLPDGRTVAAAVAEAVTARSVATGAGHGLVIGATVDRADYGLATHPSTPVLVPGFGAQGASLGALRTLFPADAVVLASASRSILRAGPDALAAAIDAAKAELPA